MRRFVLSCLCWLLVTSVVMGGDTPARKGYIFLTRDELPLNTARMELPLVEPNEDRSALIRRSSGRQVINSEETIRGTTQHETFEQSLARYEFPGLMSSDSPHADAAQYDGAFSKSLSGTRYGYRYAGHSYSSHCLTARGYEAACDPCYLPTGYHIECRNPGLLACLFGCTTPTCKLVKDRPIRSHNAMVRANRGAVATLPSFLLSDIERYELVSSIETKQKPSHNQSTGGLPQRSSSESPSPRRPKEDATLSTEIPLLPPVPQEDDDEVIEEPENGPNKTDANQSSPTLVLPNDE